MGSPIPFTPPTPRGALARLRRPLTHLTSIIWYLHTEKIWITVTTREVAQLDLSL